jgi:DNA-binding GntR family transcriptional regulator
MITEGAGKVQGAATSKAKKKRRPAAPKASSGKAKGAVSLDVQAYEAIKERILTLYFLPGQYVNEGAIASLLGMGRTPVHQAMQRLQLEELVEIVPRKGVIIRPDSAAEILKILESRETVEPDLARNAAAKATDDDAAELRELALAAEHHNDGQGAIEAFTRADRAFHARVAELSDNAVLAEFASLLHDRCMRFWYLHLWQTLDTKATAREHLAISDAIAAHDPEAAAAAMRSHIQTLRDRVRQILHIAPMRQFAPHKSR